MCVQILAVPFTLRDPQRDRSNRLGACACTHAHTHTHTHTQRQTDGLTRRDGSDDHGGQDAPRSALCRLEAQDKALNLKPQNGEHQWPEVRGEETMEDPR